MIKIITCYGECENFLGSGAILLILQVGIQPQTSNLACSYNARTLVLLFTANRLSVAMPSQDCAYDISSVAIHNLFTAHTADQVSQYTISSQRTQQIKCRNIQSLHSAHGRSSVAIHNLRTAHMVGAAFLRIYGDECLVFIATYCIP